MKILSKFTVLLVCITLILSISGCSKYSDTKTFITTDYAPEGFDAWTFFWTAPQINPEADFSLTVLDPAENIYATWNRGDDPVYKGTSQRNDFAPGFLGGDPSTLYKNEIRIVFQVDKGEIIFDMAEKYYFKFYKGGVDGKEIGTISASLQH